MAKIYTDADVAKSVLPLFRQIVELEKVLPEDEGAVTLTVFSDLSWRMCVELHGIRIAERPWLTSQFEPTESVRLLTHPEEQKESLAVVALLNARLEKIL